MKFPIVSRRKYEHMVNVAARLCARVIELEDERDQILGNACNELHKRDELVASERDALVAIYRNIRDGGA